MESSLVPINQRVAVLLVDGMLGILFSLLIGMCAKLEWNLHTSPLPKLPAIKVSDEGQKLSKPKLLYVCAVGCLEMYVWMTAMS